MESEEGLDTASRHLVEPRLYRVDSTQSNKTSLFENVEMAHDEQYAGPMAESLPTSISAFAHRGRRASSVASFAYYKEDDECAGESGDEDMRLDDDPDPSPLGDMSDEDDEVAIRESGDAYSFRRYSNHSAVSASDRLLRSDSFVTVASGPSLGGRTSQKIYLRDEDLTIVIAGFCDSLFFLWIYRLLCFLTLGTFYLMLRWLPRWYIRFVGRCRPLEDCEWVVVENQWSELAMITVNSSSFDRPLSSVFGVSDKRLAWNFEEDHDPLMPSLRVVDYRYIRLYFHPIRDKFVVFSGWKDPGWTDISAARCGIDNEERTVRERLFGPNIIDMEQKPIHQLLMDEVLHPFYIFQIASLTLWSLDEYYAYAACIAAMSVGSIVTTLIDTRTTMKRLREISRFECNVRVLRSGFWRYVPSSNLVPGDVYEISDPCLTQFPSDSVLLSGDCIVNESMLTGESVPVSKTPATDGVLKSIDLTASSVSTEIARHFLYCGTKIIRARRPQDDRDGEAAALALVVRTGFSTTNGSLVRSMLFPKPSGFKFYRDSFRYISVMGLIAGIGFLASLVNFIRLGVAWKLVIIRALDLITIAVPPALPVTLTIGTNFALGRLKRSGIYCISPQRVNVGGKVDLMCFDKTGTLTEENLDVLGVRVALAHTKRFSDVISRLRPTNPSDTVSDHPDALQYILYTMATCHSLRAVDGSLIGDPLDLKMFEFTGWSFHEGEYHGSGGGGGVNENVNDGQRGLTPPIARSPFNISQDRQHVELGILRSYEFVSHLRRASVLVRRFGTQDCDVYVKGAPECMKDICLPESFPDDYDEMLAYYTCKGYRVIGCATRHLRKMSWVKSQKMDRTVIERELYFTGFIIFENKLKHSTTAVLKELSQAKIGSIMVTGDNILTAVSVARDCGLVNPLAHCFIPRFTQGCRQGADARLEWESLDDPDFKLDNDSLLPLPQNPMLDTSLPYEMAKTRYYCLAVTGDIFRWIVDYAPPQTLRRVLVIGRVYARMSPDEKHELVEKLQSIGYCCGFCGDGANDCGALKAADVGISLSEAEASVAAPFTSRVFDISCVPRVIREGRAALATSFGCFKYMSLYSAIQFTTVSFLYASVSNLGDYQFMFIDIILILPIAIFMSSSAPYPTLSRKSPTANLVSRKVLVPLIGHMAICIAVQMAVFIAVRRQTWFIAPNPESDSPNIRNSENTTLFFVSCFEYVLAGMILNQGPPFRERWTKNVPFIATISIALIVNTYMVLGPAHWLLELMEITPISRGFSLFILGLGFVYVSISLFCEAKLFKEIVRYLGHIHRHIFGEKERKAYKLISEQMGLDTTYNPGR